MTQVSPAPTVVTDAPLTPTRHILSPATGAVIATVPEQGAREVDAAVA